MSEILTAGEKCSADIRNFSHNPLANHLYLGAQFNGRRCSHGNAVLKII